MKNLQTRLREYSSTVIGCNRAEAIAKAILVREHVDGNYCMQIPAKNFTTADALRALRL